MSVTSKRVKDKIDEYYNTHGIMPNIIGLGDKYNAISILNHYPHEKQNDELFGIRLIEDDFRLKDIHVHYFGELDNSNSKDEKIKCMWERFKEKGTLYLYTGHKDPDGDKFFNRITYYDLIERCSASDIINATKSNTLFDLVYPIFYKLASKTFKKSELFNAYIVDTMKLYYIKI